MKLLFDENLSPTLTTMLTDVYPETVHVRDIGLKASPDTDVWSYSIEHDYTIVSKDAGFRHRSFVVGFPPRVIWIGIGNCSTRDIAALLRNRVADIQAFHASEEVSSSRSSRVLDFQPRRIASTAKPVTAYQ